MFSVILNGIAVTFPEGCQVSTFPMPTRADIAVAQESQRTLYVEEIPKSGTAIDAKMKHNDGLESFINQFFFEEKDGKKYFRIGAEELPGGVMYFTATGDFEKV